MQLPQLKTLAKGLGRNTSQSNVQLAAKNDKQNEQSVILILLSFTWNNFLYLQCLLYKKQSVMKETGNLYDTEKKRSPERLFNWEDISEFQGRI